MSSAFEEGFFSGTADHLQQVNKNRLELTMKSKAIEMELAKRAQEHTQNESRDFIKPGDWDPLVRSINPKIGSVPSFSSSVPQQAFLNSQKQIPTINAKGEWASSMAGKRNDRNNRLLSPDEKAIAKAYLHMSGAPKELLAMFDQPDITNLGLLAVSRLMPQSNPGVVKEVSNSIVALRNAPEFFDALTDIGTKYGESTLRAVQYSLSNSSDVLDAITDSTIAPELKQKLRSTVTLFLFATGGKTLTANEQRAVMGLVSAPSNNLAAVHEAKRDFLDTLAQPTKGHIQSGKLGLRGLEYASEFNDLVEAAGFPEFAIEKQDMLGPISSPASMPAPRKAKKPLADMLKEAGL